LKKVVCSNYAILRCYSRYLTIQQQSSLIPLSRIGYMDQTTPQCSVINHISMIYPALINLQVFHNSYV